MKPIKDTALFRTLTGKNKTGKIIHSVIDVLPVPNIHEVVKASVKQNPDSTIKDVVKISFKKIDWVRVGIGVFVAVGIAKGWFSSEQAKEILNLLTQLFA